MFLFINKNLKELRLLCYVATQHSYICTWTLLINSFTKNTQNHIKIGQYQAASTWNRIELILHVLPMPTTLVECSNELLAHLPVRHLADVALPSVLTC